MTTTVIVDDSNPAISYSTGWTSGGITSSNNTYEYNGTVHEAAANGLTLSYEFTGTRISVYGTVDTNVTTGVATSTYVVDNDESSRGNFSSGSLLFPNIQNFGVQSHLLLYQSPILSNSSHSLSITISNITNGSPKYYLDFFTVDAKFPESASQVIVDDSSSDIKYVGDWSDSHAFNEYLTTDHNAPNTGNANATYTFTGTSISVYGAIINDYRPRTQIDFYIDSELITRYTAPSTEAIKRHVPLFSKSGLPSGPHTLVIAGTVTAQWWLDYLIYSPTSNAASSSSSVAGQDGTIGTIAPPVGPIVGGVVGGVGLLLCIGILLLALRRRRRQAALQEVAAASGNQPFPGTTDSRIPNEKAIVAGVASKRSRGGGGRIGERNDASSVPMVPAVPTHHSTSQPVDPEREVDGGVRLASGDSEEDHVPSLLPPSYAVY